MSSFYLWLDHELTSVGQGYQNYSGQLFKMSDNTFSNATVYSSPFRQWVSDVSVSGAYVPSGVYVNNQYVPRESGTTINYNMGGVMFNPAFVSGNANVTSQYAIKDFNIYYTSEKEEQLLFEKAHKTRSKIGQVLDGLSYNDQPYPCIFLKNIIHQNKPYAFGGLDESVTTVRAIVLASNMFALDGAVSTMADGVRKSFPILEAHQLPYNYSGDIRGGGNYSYPDLCAAQSGYLARVKDVTISKLDEVRSRHISEICVVALVDFDLSFVRQPHAQ